MRRSGRGQPALEIGDDVVDVLEADRKAHIAIGHAGCDLIAGAELGMRRGRGVDGEASRIADIGDVVEQLKRVDEAPSGFLACRQLEADKAAIAALQVFVRPLAEHASLERWVDHLRHFRPLGEVIGDRQRVGGMALDAQRQRLDALQDQEGVER